MLADLRDPMAHGVEGVFGEIGDDGSGNIPVVLVSDIMPGTSFSGSATGNLAPVFNSFKAITLKVVDDSDNVCRDAVHVTGSLN